MPYKDPDQRRVYDRLYKREMRQASSQSNQRPTEVRAYVCHRHPNFRLPGGISFHECVLVTKDQALQDIVEQSPEYGEVIFRLVLVL